MLKGKTPQKLLPFPLSLKIRWGVEVGWSEKQNYHMIWHCLKLPRLIPLIGIRTHTYTYVTKTDPLYLLSESHPAELESPQTTQATDTHSERAETREYHDTPCAINKRKRERQPSDLYNIIAKNNIKTDLHLCPHAMMKLNENNNPLLSEFIMTRDDNRRNSMIATAWKLKQQQQ